MKREAFAGGFSHFEQSIGVKVRATTLEKMTAVDAQLEVNMTEGRSTTQILFDQQRHEVVGRNAIEVVRIEVTAQSPQMSFSSVIDERIHTQVLRIAEEDQEEQ